MTTEVKESVTLPMSSQQVVEIISNENNTVQAYKDDANWKEIVKNLSAAFDAICELPDIEKEIAGTPVTLTFDSNLEGIYHNYSVAVYITVDGKRIKAYLETDSPQSMFGDKLDEVVVKELYDYIRSPDFKKEIDVRKRAAERLRVANEAKEIHLQSNYKGFEGIMIPRGYRFGECFAYKVKTYTKTDDEGKEVEEEILTSLGNCCAVTTRFRVDGNSKVMLRIRFITSTLDIKDIDVEVGSLNDLRSINEFARAHSLYIRNAPEFKYMLDEQFENGVNSNKLPILEATTKIGWHGDAFVSGRECYGGNIICVNTEACEKWYKEGTLDGYMQGIKGLVNIPEVRLAMGIEVAAMILSIVGVAPFSVLIYGRTSGIKSTRVKVAHSVRGNPNRIMQNMEGSRTSPDKTIKESNDSAISFDEVKNEDDIKKANALNKILPHGKSRSRYNYKTDKNDSTDFSCIAFFTSERAIFDTATYGGSRVRCMVLKTREDMPYLPDEVKAFEKHVAAKNTSDATPKNFGHLGPIIYDVIMEHPNIRAEFDAIKDRFEATTAIENRIADMQAVTALGMELLEEVFDGLRDKYQWLERMDSVQVVKDQTADYLEESTVPEWELQLQHLLSKVDCDRRYLDPDPVIETDDEGNKTERKKEGTYPVRGYLHKIAGEELLCLNSVETEEYLRRKGMDPETLFSGVRNNSEMLKTYNKKNKKGETIKGGLKIQIHQKDNIPGGLYYALRIEKLREWFKDHECDDEEEAEEEKTIDVSAELDAINAREEENVPLLKKYFTASTKNILTMPTKTYEDRFMENIDNFILWYETQGHSHEEAVQKADELKSRIKLKQEQLTFYNSMIKRGKAKEWSPKIELFWINNK